MPGGVDDIQWVEVPNPVTGRSIWVSRNYVTVDGEIRPGVTSYDANAASQGYINVPTVLSATGSRLPSQSEVDLIYLSSQRQLSANPQPAGPGMTTRDAYLLANSQSSQELNRIGDTGGLIAGHRKDLIQGSTPSNVAIYGWYDSDGNPIQPVFTGHGGSYADYSHGVRLVRDTPPEEGEIITNGTVGELSPEALEQLQSGAPPGLPGGFGGGQYSSFADCMAAQAPPPETESPAPDPAVDAEIDDAVRRIPATEAGGTAAIDTSNVANNVIQAQSGASRNLPLPVRLVGTINEGMRLSGIPGLTFTVGSGGQLDQASGTGSVRHNIDSSSAADGSFALNGRTLTYPQDAATLERIMQGMYSAGVRGFGFGDVYMGNSTFHLDMQGTTPGSPGGGFSMWGGTRENPGPPPTWIQSAISGIDPGTLSPEQLAEWEEFARQNPGAFSASGSHSAAAANCLPANASTSCSPVSPGSLGVATSVAAGQGIATPPGLTNAIDAVNSTELGNIANNVQDALGDVATTIDGAIATTTAGLSDALNQVSQGVSQAVQGLAGNILPGITNVVPTAFNTLIAGGSLSTVVANSATQILGNAVPQLGNFLPYFNAAAGAIASGAGIQGLLGSVSNLAFGQMQAQLGNLVNIAGFNPENLINSIGNIEGFEGMTSFVDGFSSALGNTVNMLGSLESVLPNLVNNPSINAFSSLFGNFNHMVTQGFGAISNDLSNFGFDLSNLGRLGDLNDLFNIGTPTQLVRQIIDNGIEGLAEPLLEQISLNNINLTDFNNPRQNELITEILSTASTPQAIQNIKNAFSIDDRVTLNNVTDLLDLEKILPNSKDAANFEQLRDIAPTLSLACGGGLGNLRSLGDLGNLLKSLENTEKFTELNQELTPIRPEELNLLLEQFPTNSFFGDAPVLADFIGSAGGYIHTDAFNKKAILLEEINQSGALDNYKLLSTLLADTLGGAYTGPDPLDPPTDIIALPTTAGYTFGSYTTLDDAVTAVVAAIETELSAVKTSLETTDVETYKKLMLLESLHQESARFLAHERNMRLKYGVEFGNPNREILYNGDGSTLFFSIPSSNVTQIKVYVDGVKQREIRNYTVNTVSNIIEFVSAPGNGSLIEIEFVDQTINEVQVSNNDVWQFANNLEGYSNINGFGNVAEFLFKVTSNDFHGQRIKATMMQARNKTKVERAGINCPGINRIDGTSDATTVNYTDRTGIWSSDPQRAGEIWLQQTYDVESYHEYYLEQLKLNKETVRPIVDNLLADIMAQLIFYDSGLLAITPKMIDLYDQYNDRPEYAYGENLKQSASTINTNGAFALGPYRQLLNEILRIESIKNTSYPEVLSKETKEYLKQVNIDVKKGVILLQKILVYNASQHLKISEKDFINIFGMPAAGKYIIKNIAESN